MSDTWSGRTREDFVPFNFLIIYFLFLLKIFRSSVNVIIILASDKNTF